MKFLQRIPSSNTSMNANTDRIYLFKVNNQSAKKNCKICLKIIIKMFGRRQKRRSSVSITTFEQISHIILVLALLADFEQVKPYWKVLRINGLLQNKHFLSKANNRGTRKR